MRSTGDDAFFAAYEGNFVDVLRYVQRRCPAPHVDDVVAETFTIAWRRRRELPGQPRPWLFRTASNVMKSAARAELKQRSLAVRSWEPWPAPADVDGNIDLVAAWRRLARMDREVLALHVWEDLTDAEASQVLGCSRGTYSMRLSRAKRHLASALREGEPIVAHSQLEPTEGTP